MNFDSSTGKKVSLSKLFNQPVYVSFPFFFYISNILLFVDILADSETTNSRFFLFNLDAIRTKDFKNRH